MGMFDGITKGIKNMLSGGSTPQTQTTIYDDPNPIPAGASTYKVNLIKERERKVGICLDKHNAQDIQAEVNVVFDVSGSTEDLYESSRKEDSEMQKVIERFFPIATRLSPNPVKSMRVWVFNGKCHALPPMTFKNFETYVKDEIVNKNYVGGGTVYSNALSMVFDSCKGITLPKYTIVLTDGDNDTNDYTRTEDFMVKASEKDYFWQFVGVGHARFEFLMNLDTLIKRKPKMKIDNANFFSVKNLADLTDDQLYGLMLKEFPVWDRGRKSLGI